ncbi:hypothetical protein HPB49_007036 [Dermacentor silvarum]|uniref:Uncharacterized protein n=1 Tax=Dermacentor silvarum TaxID=543639 RepID=A0ACB8DBW4_DERSI|nr:hypothetical protein HPB49_007036 [Dermacentor silvarum]
MKAGACALLYDFSRFDHQPTSDEVIVQGVTFERAEAATWWQRSDVVLFVKLLEHGFRHATITSPPGFGEQQTFKATGGLMSGLESTFAVGTPCLARLRGIWPTDSGTITGRPSAQQQPRRPPRQQQPLEDAACRAAAEYARKGQLAEAANVEAISFHRMLLDQNRQLVEEPRASRVVQQQLGLEMRGLREATALIATTLRQLVAALAHGLRESPQS